MSTRTWQQIEGGFVFLALVATVAALGAPWAWWISILIFFVPDLSFAAYAAGPKIGAAAYNAVHIYGLGLAFAALGLALASPGLVAAGLLLAAHVGLDRLLGYGLKEPTGFKHTHMGNL